mmetsp:Transcript_14906/g.21692  ORF Transcript_14906/g.21692 Transcript_14906/m.21692 type:complete len:261 (-) Transcript_14906:47-829(-)
MVQQKGKKQGGKKGAKRRVVDPFAKKEVYDVKAPSIFANTAVCKTFVNKSAGQRISSDYLRGRVFETNLADLQNNDELAYRKVKLVCEEVQGRSCLTNFYGLDFTRDWLCSLLRKWQTLIEAHVDAVTKDGYRLRMFCIGFTARRANQVKKTCYAKQSQVLQIRKIMMDTMTNAAQSNDLKNLVPILISESLSKDITKACAHIFPLQNVYVRKVKMVKRPKFDITKLLEMYKNVPTETASKTEDTGAQNLLTQELQEPQE